MGLVELLMTFVELKAVSLTYRLGKETTLALADATIGIGKGEFVAVVGPSGCGKSTIMKLVTGLLPATTGEVRGRRPEGDAADQGRRHGVPEPDPDAVAQDDRQRAAADGDRRAAQAPLPPPSRRIRRASAMALLETVGLADFADKYPWQLSGGMQQRSNLCRALIHEPELLMLDEPFGALDAFTREELWGVMQALWLEKRFTGVLVTHDLREAVYLADTVYVDEPPARAAW